MAFVKQLPSFNVQSDGFDIFLYPLSKGPVRITTSLTFELESARRTCQLSLEEFDNLPGDPCWAEGKMSKSDLLAYERLIGRISAVENEARMNELERSR